MKTPVFSDRQQNTIHALSIRIFVLFKLYIYPTSFIHSSPIWVRILGAPTKNEVVMRCAIPLKKTLNGLGMSQHLLRVGGFHSHGGTPIAGCFFEKIPLYKVNDLGVPLFQETCILWSHQHVSFLPGQIMLRTNPNQWWFVESCKTRFVNCFLNPPFQR